MFWWSTKVGDICSAVPPVQQSSRIASLCYHGYPYIYLFCSPIWVAPLATWATLGRELVRSCQRGGVCRLYRVCLAIKKLIECRSQLCTSDVVTFPSVNCFKRSTHDTVAAKSHGKRVSHAFDDANQMILSISSQISCHLPRKYMPTSIPSGQGCFES